MLKSYDWMPLATIDEVGIVRLVDGSLFPTLTSMCWGAGLLTEKVKMRFVYIWKWT